MAKLPKPKKPCVLLFAVIFSYVVKASLFIAYVYLCFPYVLNELFPGASYFAFLVEQRIA